MGAPLNRTLFRILTPQDKATYAKWMRLVAALYGCAALVLLWAAMALPSESPDRPRGSAELADHQTQAFACGCPQTRSIACIEQ
jgi:hypothetical protein